MSKISKLGKKNKKDKRLNFEQEYTYKFTWSKPVLVMVIITIYKN